MILDSTVAFNNIAPGLILLCCVRDIGLAFSNVRPVDIKALFLYPESRKPHSHDVDVRLSFTVLRQGAIQTIIKLRNKTKVRSLTSLHRSHLRLVSFLDANLQSRLLRKPAILYLPFLASWIREFNLSPHGKALGLDLSQDSNVGGPKEGGVEIPRTCATLSGLACRPQDRRYSCLGKLYVRHRTSTIVSGW